MKCMLIHMRLFVGFTACLFFAVAGVICISVYFSSDKVVHLFEMERTLVLIAGCLELFLMVVTMIANYFTTKLLSSYMSEEDPLYVGYWNMLGMDKVKGKVLDEPSDSAGDEESFLEPRLKFPPEFKGLWGHISDDADKIVVHKKKETEVIHTEIPDLTMKKLLDHLENKGPNSTFDLEAVKLLKIDQLGDLIMEKKAAGKDASNDQELREMIEKMERLKQTRLEAKRYGNQPYLTLDLTLDSPLGKNGQERLQQREHIRTQIPANIDLENIALEDAVNLLEILDLDNISSFNTFEN